MRRTAYVVTVVFSLAILAGCASGESGASPSSTAPTAAPSRTATPSPTATETALPEADPDDPSTWTITQDGIGPLVLGAPFADALAAMPEGSRNDTEHCAWSTWWNAPDNSFGLYAARSSDAGTDASSPVLHIDASAWTDPTTADGPRTAEGIGLGATVDEVKVAYPDGVDVSLYGGIEAVQVGRIFFQHRDGSLISAITVTSSPQPPYEVCG